MGAAPAIIVVGASAGGVEAVRFLAAALPPDFRAAVFVVLHIGAHRSELPWLLNQMGPLRAAHAVSGDPIQAGRIYVAPPDHHLLVEPGCVRLTKGPRENWAPGHRPAVPQRGPGLRVRRHRRGPDRRLERRHGRPV